MNESEDVNSYLYVHFIAAPLDQPGRGNSDECHGWVNGSIKWDEILFGCGGGGSVSFTLKRNMLACVTAWMNLESITQHEIN